MNECQGCIAAEAAKMARSMWQAQHGREPKVDDAKDFLALVRACRSTLKGVKVEVGHLAGLVATANGLD